MVGLLEGRLPLPETPYHPLPPRETSRESTEPLRPFPAWIRLGKAVEAEMHQRLLASCFCLEKLGRS